MEFSVVIPAYNEENKIISTLKEVLEYVERNFGHDWEIIVVDDGSQDSTSLKVKEFKEEIRDKDKIKLLVNNPNMGKGASVRRGMLEARGTIRLFMDADSATKIQEYDKMVPFLEKGADVVVGSRKLQESVITIKQPFVRRLMSKVHHHVVKFLLGAQVRDYNCGFKAFKGSVADKLFSTQKIDRWVFDAEVLFLASKFGFKVYEIPIIWQHKGGSKVNVIRDGFSSFKGLFQIKLNQIRKVYK